MALRPSRIWASIHFRWDSQADRTTGFAPAVKAGGRGGGICSATTTESVAMEEFGAGATTIPHAILRMVLRSIPVLR